MLSYLRKLWRKWFPGKPVKPAASNWAEAMLQAFESVAAGNTVRLIGSDYGQVISEVFLQPQRLGADIQICNYKALPIYVRANRFADWWQGKSGGLASPPHSPASRARDLGK